MNLGQVARILSGFCLFFSLLQASMLAVAFLEQDDASPFDSTRGFIWGAGIGLALAALLGQWGRRASRDFFRREGLAVVGLAWLVSGTLGAVPFYMSGALDGVTDAVFESISGLTTTGASVCGTGDNPAIESLPRSILLWRSLLQWIGGLGIIFVFIVLLPAMGVTGKNLLASEQVGVSNDNLKPSMRNHARSLARLYVGMTIACALILWVHGLLVEEGQSGFDAVCHSFTTLATGGFSTKNLSVGSYESVFIEVVIIVFMFFAGANFPLLISAIHGRSVGRLYDNPEFRAYLKIVLILIAAVTLILWFKAHYIKDAALHHRDYDSIWTCLRDASFQIVSIITSTGYGTADYQNWPQAALLILLFAMFVGGCTGSTAGGYKVLRLVVLLKLMTFSIRRFIRPKSVEKLKLGDDVLPNSVVSAIVALLVLWITAMIVGALSLALIENMGMLAALSTTLSMVSCTGPALTEVHEASQGVFEVVGAHNVGPYGGYGDLQPVSKVLMSFQMVLGRLEILAPLVLFAPGIWKR